MARANAGPNASGAPMLIDSRIADLSDKELEDLHGNAIRLAQSGAGAQRAEAERLLPIIGAEVQRRARKRSVAMHDIREQKREAAAKSRRKKPKTEN
jgi:hypothetical protein